MIRISKETDYGIVLLSCLAREPGVSLSATTLAERGRLPLPTVSKILKAMTRGGLLSSQRGAYGGYALARRPAEITVADIITVIDGPIALTDCSVIEPQAPSEEHKSCDHIAHCHLSGHWAPINRAIRSALEGVTLADLTRPSDKVVPLVFHAAHELSRSSAT